jgi:excisionase family DNA binding protein
MTDPAQFPPVLTAAMAAELLQVHVEYLRKMVRDGRLPAHRFPGGRELRFLRDELLEWLAAQPGPSDRQPAHAPVTTRTQRDAAIGT